MNLRPHQKQCIDNIKLHFDTSNEKTSSIPSGTSEFVQFPKTKVFGNLHKALIKMFCGSGKSFVIYHSILEYIQNLAVIVVPSINLITQFINYYLLDENKI